MFSRIAARGSPALKRWLPRNKSFVAKSDRKFASPCDRSAACAGATARPCVHMSVHGELPLQIFPSKNGSGRGSIAKNHQPGFGTRCFPMYHVQLQKHRQLHDFSESSFFPVPEVPEWIRPPGLSHWSTNSRETACPSALRHPKRKEGGVNEISSRNARATCCQRSNACILSRDSFCRPSSADRFSADI